MTFDEWWKLWEPYWARRGARVGQYCMARENDSGGYVLGNVRIQLSTENVADMRTRIISQRGIT